MLPRLDFPSRNGTSGKRMWLGSRLSVLSSIRLSFTNTTLSETPRLYSKSPNPGVSPPLLLFLKAILAIPGPLCFHVNFRVTVNFQKALLGLRLCQEERSGWREGWVTGQPWFTSLGFTGASSFLWISTNTPFVKFIPQ